MPFVKLLKNDSIGSKEIYFNVDKIVSFEFQNNLLEINCVDKKHIFNNIHHVDFQNFKHDLLT